MKEMKKWLALLAITALMLSLGGCGGSSNSGGSSNNGGSGSSPSGKTYTGTNGSVTAANGTRLTVTSASLTVGNIPSTGSVTVAAQSTTASFSCTLSDDKGNTGSISRLSQTVTVTQSGTDWTFTFTDGLQVILDTASGTITLGGTMPSVTMSNSTRYTLTDDFIIDVNEGSGGGDDDSDSDDPGTGGGGTTVDVSNAVTIILNSDGTATYNGTAVPQADWVWSMDLVVDHWQGGNNKIYNFVKNSPAEFYIGTKPTGNLYIAHDIVYLPDTLKSSFTGSAKNDSETVRTCNYSDTVIADSISKIKSNTEDYSVAAMTNCIFAALDKNPAQDSDAAAMLHSASEAYANPVLHIKGAGTYILKGEWNGQIWFEAENEDEDTVKVILNGVTVTCGVGPAIIFTDFYECDTDAAESTASWDVSSQMENAGVKVYVSDGTTNTFTGANLPRILKIQPKEDTTTTIDGTDVSQQKKRYKWDGAFHSRVSIAIDGGNYDGSASSGTGSLKVVSTTCEGMDSEMHLTINGGAVTVTAPDDAINVNEDGISVFTMNAGTLTATGTTQEGDGIDSNGYIVINGGTVKATAGGSGGTAGLDADYSGDYDRSYGIYINGGTTTTNGTMGTVYQNGGTLNNTGGSGGNGGQPGGDQRGGETPPAPPSSNGTGGPAMHR